MISVFDIDFLYLNPSIDHAHWQGGIFLFQLSNVNFKNIIKYPQINISEHKVTFICGKSGSGKSTLLKLLNASISPDEGEVLYHSIPVTDYDTVLLRREVILASQSVYLSDQSIRDNFMEYYSYRGLPAPDDTIICKFLDLCIANFPLTANCRELSGGERQRVFLAICLSFLPKVLMLDEPTSALDEITANSLLKSLTDYCHKEHITLIAITHDLSLAKKYADELILLPTEA